MNYEQLFIYTPVVILSIENCCGGKEGITIQKDADLHARVGSKFMK